MLGADVETNCQLDESFL